MQNSPTEYLKPRVVDVEVISPVRARVTLEPSTNWCHSCTPT